MLNDLSRAPFRPFFLLAGLAAVAGGMPWLSPSGDAAFLHMCILLFGMGGAAMAGYLLTALHSWTGQHDLPPGLLWTLVGLWGLARGVAPWSGQLPWGIVMLPGVAFHAGLAAYLLHRLIGARAWHRVPLALAPLGPGLAEQYLLWSRRTGGSIGDAALPGALVFALLLVAIGGRAVPAFTQSGLRHLGRDGKVCVPGWLHRLSVGLLSVGLALTFGTAPGGWTGYLLLCAGLLQLLRWMGWCPWRLAGLPALWMLHGAWIWLAAGLVLLGLVRLGIVGLGPATAVHALTMGAMGGMCLGIMLRAAMPRTAWGLQPTALQLAASALVLISPLPRLLWIPMLDNPLRPAALCWSIGWILFVIALWPALRGSVSRPVLSGLRPDGGH